MAEGPERGEQGNGRRDEREKGVAHSSYIEVSKGNGGNGNVGMVFRGSINSYSYLFLILLYVVEKVVLTQ
jgi:hypothetical protein